MEKVKGIVFCSIFALISYFVCRFDFCKYINLNSLTLAIIFGVIIGNIFNKLIPEIIRVGIVEFDVFY